MLRHWRLATLGIVMLAALAAVMVQGPMAQDPAYHRFADQRELLGVPHLMDVLSNLPFLVIGIVGMALCGGVRRPPRATAWWAMFAGVSLVCFGSAHYHWAPSDATLVWDRLPMTVAFVALPVALLAEHAGQAHDRLLLAPALMIGVASVLWWHWTGDLRVYLWVQYALLACIPLVLLLFAARFTHRRYLLYGLGLYVLAKLAEGHDLAIYVATGQRLAGHTVKHLLAAGALSCVLYMLWRRTPVASAVPA